MGRFTSTNCGAIRGSFLARRPDHFSIFRADSPMARKIAPTCALCAVMSLLTACGAADAPTVPSSTVVTPPAPTTGIVQGIVKRAAFFGATFYPEAPLAGAQVLVTE